LLRVSWAGPVEPLPASHESSAGFELLKCCTPPTEMMFLPQACGRAFWLPRFDMLCVHGIRWSKTMSSASAEFEV
jgi:hypothetical protein